jgi:translation initiation factor RLI1
MLKIMVPEIINKIEDQKYVEAFVNLVGLMYYLHENVKHYSGDEIFSVTLAHDALSETLTEMSNIDDDSDYFNGVAEFCAHLAVLRLQEAIGDEVAARAAKSLSFCLETIINQQKAQDGEDDRWTN